MLNCCDAVSQNSPFCFSDPHHCHVREQVRHILGLIDQDGEFQSIQETNQILLCRPPHIEIVQRHIGTGLFLHFLQERGFPDLASSCQQDGLETGAGLKDCFL